MFTVTTVERIHNASQIIIQLFVLVKVGYMSNE